MSLYATYLHSAGRKARLLPTFQDPPCAFPAPYPAIGASEHTSPFNLQHFQLLRGFKVPANRELPAGF